MNIRPNIDPNCPETLKLPAPFQVLNPKFLNGSFARRRGTPIWIPKYYYPSCRDSHKKGFLENPPKQYQGTSGPKNSLLFVDCALPSFTAVSDLGFKVLGLGMSDCPQAFGFREQLELESFMLGVRLRRSAQN